MTPTLRLTLQSKAHMAATQITWNERRRAHQSSTAVQAE